MTENVKHVEVLRYAVVNVLYEEATGGASEGAIIRTADRIVAEVERLQREAAGDGGDLESQVDRLAKFIMAEIPGEPSESEGAVDTAIRWMRARLARKPRPTGTDERCCAMAGTYACKCNTYTAFTTPASASAVAAVRKLFNDCVSTLVPEQYADGYLEALEHVDEELAKRNDARGGGEAEGGLRCWVNVYSGDGMFWAYETEAQAKSDASLATKRVAVPMQEITHPAPAALDAEWTDAQCIAFMATALRHVEYKRGNKGPSCDDIRMGVKFAARATTGASE